MAVPSTLSITIHGHVPFLRADFQTNPLVCSGEGTWTHTFNGSTRVYYDSRGSHDEDGHWLPTPALVAEHLDMVGSRWVFFDGGRESVGEDWLSLRRLAP